MHSNSFRHSTSVSPPELPSRPDLTLLDFGNGYKDPISGAASVSPPLLGIINASYSLGAICAVPLAPMFNQWVGRRWAIMSGSCTMVFGAILQGFARDGKSFPRLP